MINIKILETHKTIPTSSWALWNNNGLSDFTFFKDNISQLHTNVVILGLNRSDKANENQHIPFVNFHLSGHRGDKRLKRYIQENQLNNIKGCLMTDLSKIIKTDSNQVKLDESNDTLRLQKLLSKTPSKERTIICLGNKCYEGLCKGLDIRRSTYRKGKEPNNLRISEGKIGDEKWTIYRVWMHSSWGRFEEKGSIELPLQLKYINRKV